MDTTMKLIEEAAELIKELSKNRPKKAAKELGHLLAAADAYLNDNPEHKDLVIQSRNDKTEKWSNTEIITL